MSLPVESVEARLARLEAPVKYEFCRLESERWAYVDALWESGDAPLDAVEPHITQRKSKNALKKERNQARSSTSDLCNAFIQGRCTHSSCRFNHDVTAFLDVKPADLPGDCPFSGEAKCPYGITCRWATKHKVPDPLMTTYLEEKHRKEIEAAAAEAAVAAAAASAAATALEETLPEPMEILPVLEDAGAAPVEIQFQQNLEEEGRNEQAVQLEVIDNPLPAAAEPAVEINTFNAVAAASSPAGVSEAEEHPAQPTKQPKPWFTMDDTIPRETLVLPPRPSVPAFLNFLSRDANLKLRKGTYDFSKADAALEALGIKNTASKRGKQGRKGENGASTSQGGPEAKRPRLDPEAPPAPAEAAAPAAAAVPSVGSDEAFLAAATTAAPAAPVAPPAAAHAGPNGATSSAAAPEIDVETRPHPRERRTIDFRGKTFLAPLTTVGNLPFRRLCKSLGADVTCGEMAVATNLLQGQTSEWALLKRHPEEDCFGVQLCGGFGDAMGRCAQLIEDNLQVDFVDVNFGCPIDVVINKGAGSACLLRPRRIEDIVRSMTSVLSCPLTLKMRKGYHDRQDIAHELIPQVAHWGASAVTLHGRTREQRYSRLADWDYIGKCASVAAPTGMQVIGNGDVMSWQDHENAVNNAGVATTYVARGALMKPWVFTEIKEKRDWDISASERLDIVKKFASNGLEHWGSDLRGVESTRRFMLEWLSFAYRYVPVGLLEALPQRTNLRPPAFVGRNDLETLLASPDPRDWIKITELVLGPAPPGFLFTPKHKATSYAAGKGGGGGGGGGAKEQEF